MTLDWSGFTPIPALLGGALIGLAAALLLLALGRIAGISGIVGGLLRRPDRAETPWRLAFVLGLGLAPLAWTLVAALPPPRIAADTPTLVAAGLLVGFGARLGSGCTSGHGVCGLSRLSPRSLAATLTFMATGFLTVFAVRHLI
ncbi:YeeE/YedE family protein [Phaeospirillum tilakii]|uniref:YeeE/YedE family protein n=1 Tax=Phaeospirillum tilakii TaxID=741673 RepID=A0ABW5C7D1_9PROT